MGVELSSRVAPAPATAAQQQPPPRVRERGGTAPQAMKVCVLGSIERGAGASLTACGLVHGNRSMQSGMGRRPKHDGTFRSNKPSRGHPELSLDPQCMQPLSHRHCLPNIVAPYRSQTRSSRSMMHRFASSRCAAHDALRLAVGARGSLRQALPRRAVARRAHGRSVPRLHRQAVRNAHRPRRGPARSACAAARHALPAAGLRGCFWHSQRTRGLASLQHHAIALLV